MDDAFARRGQRVATCVRGRASGPHVGAARRVGPNSGSKSTISRYYSNYMIPQIIL